MEFRTIHSQDTTGRPIASGTVYVYTAGTTTQASIYDEALAELTQPLETGQDGNIGFRARNGEYDVSVSKNGQTVTAQNVRFYDPADEKYTTRAALVTAVSDGYTWPNGAIVSDGTVSYRASAGATDISDLPGLVPHDPSGEFDAFVEHFATTSPTAAVNITTALQNACDYVTAIGSGTFGKGGKLGLKAREYVIADNDADGYGVTISDSITIKGAGFNSTTLYINTNTDTMFYVGKGDAAILADTSNTALVRAVTFEGIQFYNTSSTGPTGGCFVECDRASVDFRSVRMINHFTAIKMLGTPENCRFIDSEIIQGSNQYALLSYDGMSGAFTAGLTVTGGTSGATGIIVSDDNSGTSGVLTLRALNTTEAQGPFEDNEALTDSGSGVAVVNGTIRARPRSCGILIDRRRINAALSAIGYVDSGDGFTYTEPNTVFISNSNIEMGSTPAQHGGQHAVLITCGDTIDIAGSHVAWGTLSCIGIVPAQANMALSDIRVSGGLIDPLPNKTKNGLYIADDNVVGSTTIGSVSLSNLAISGVTLGAGVRVTVDTNRLTLTGVEMKQCGTYGLIVNDANAKNIIVQGCNFFSTNQLGGTTAAVYIADGEKISLIGNNFMTGYRGIQLDTNADRVTIVGNTFDGMSSGTSIYLPTSLAGEVTVSGNDVDESATIASANRLYVPIGQDYIHVTGTTAIYEIRTDAPTNSAYPGRRITMSFADALTIYDDAASPGGAVVPNLRITADVTTAAGYVAEFVYAPSVESGKWILASTRANA